MYPSGLIVDDLQLSARSIEAVRAFGKRISASIASCSDSHKSPTTTITYRKSTQIYVQQNKACRSGHKVRFKLCTCRTNGIHYENFSCARWLSFRLLCKWIYVSIYDYLKLIQSGLFFLTLKKF